MSGASGPRSPRDPRESAAGRRERAPRGRALAVALALAAGACGGSAPSAPPPAPRPVELLDAAALRARVEGSAAEVVVLNFWATWCIPCLEEMPGLVAVSRELAGDGVELLAVCMDIAYDDGVLTPEGISAFAHRRGIDLPLAAFTDGTGAAVAEFDVGALPHTSVYSRGRLVGDREGQITPDELRALIRTARGG